MLIEKLAAAIGAAHVLTGPDMARYARDWMGRYEGQPVTVIRPGSTAEVSACVKIAAQHGVPVVPISGNTGLVGGTMTKGGLLLSLERMNRIGQIKRDARLVIAEAGVILTRLHEAAETEGLYFPLWFGARGSAMLGGVLSTNAGGSNVLRYGSTRALCLGLEVVLPDGRVLNLMSELHKDNSGYDLKNLFIGSEGTLGIITAAVMKLVPAPKAHATATIAARSLTDALTLLNRMQEATGNRVEAFEFMPRTYSERLKKARPDLARRPPLSRMRRPRMQMATSPSFSPSKPSSPRCWTRALSPKPSSPATNNSAGRCGHGAKQRPRSELACTPRLTPTSACPWTRSTAS